VNRNKLCATSIAKALLKDKNGTVPTSKVLEYLNVEDEHPPKVPELLKEWIEIDANQKKIHVESNNVLK
jgi:hypothetical protein